MNENKNTVNISPLRKRVFQGIMILFPFALFFLLEICLRIFGYGNNLHLFINNPDKDFRKYKIVNPIIGKKYFHILEYTSPGSDVFLKEKPANGFRIFVLGSSTVAGFPYGENLMFSRILQERLQDTYPEKYIEVVNTAITAINSYTLLDYMNDILKEKPDAILFYEGHNEFYGAFGIGSNEKLSKYRALTFLHLDLLNLRIYQLLRNMISGIIKIASGSKSSSDVKGTLMKRIVGNKDIIYKSEIYNKGILQFKENMSDLLRKAQKKHVPVFFSEVVCNIRDLKPFGSTADAQYPAAIDMYNKAKEYEKNGEFEKAKTCYYQAKDYDCVRFRASEEINDVIRHLAGEYNAYLVPMKIYFEKNSPNGIMGNNLFTEHVHPNIAGYFLMADVFYNEIVKSKIISPVANIVNYKSSGYYKINWGYTALDSLLAIHRVTNLSYHWPFQPINAPFTDYRQVYRPVSVIDSLAFSVMKYSDIKVTDAHLQLAKYYKGIKDYYNAYKEYHALITCYPYFSEDYLDAAECLIKIQDFPGALKFLDKSLDLKESFFGYFAKGEILLLKNDYKAAIESFNRAGRFAGNSSNNEKLLSKELEAYYYDGQLEKAKEIFNRLHQTNPSYKPSLSKNRADYNLLLPVQVKDQINKALDYYKKGDTESALQGLKRSLDIKETALANRIVGEILLKRSDKDAIIYLLRAYPDFKYDVDFLYNLCLYYLYARKSQQALDILNKIKQLNPTYINIPRLEKLIQENQ